MCVCGECVYEFLYVCLYERERLNAENANLKSTKNLQNRKRNESEEHHVLKMNVIGKREKIEMSVIFIQLIEYIISFSTTSGVALFISLEKVFLFMFSSYFLAIFYRNHFYRKKK